LKAIRSSRLPPPRATISRSGRGTGLQRVEAGDRLGDARGRVGALHRHRPDEDAAREAVGEAVQDVADDRAGRRGHDSDDVGQEGQLALAVGVEQPLRGEPAATLLDHPEQRALARHLHLVDDELVLRARAVGRDAAGADHLQPRLRLHLQPRDLAAPAHAVDQRIGVLEREIDMAGGRARHPGELAAHAHALEVGFEPPLDGAGQVRHRHLGKIA
jgi:hypothetical protein